MQLVTPIQPAEEGGYWVEMPALVGCFAQGETIEGLLDEAPKAIPSHIETPRENGQQIPERNDRRHGQVAAGGMGHTRVCRQFPGSI